MRMHTSSLHTHVGSMCTHTSPRTLTQNKNVEKHNKIFKITNLTT